MAETNEVTYETGAKRSKLNPRYRDIDLGLLERIGNAFSEGAVKYEGDMMPFQKNWKNGDLPFALDVIDHAIEHLFSFKEVVLRGLNRDETVEEFNNEDHLGHLGANLVMLDYFHRRGFFNPDKYEELTPAADTVEVVAQDAVPTVTAELGEPQGTLTDRISGVIKQVFGGK
jgi:hypothetical protein